MISFLVCLFMGHGKAIDFYKLILYLVILLKLFFLEEFGGITYYVICI